MGEAFAGSGKPFDRGEGSLGEDQMSCEMG